MLGSHSLGRRSKIKASIFDLITKFIQNNMNEQNTNTDLDNKEQGQDQEGVQEGEVETPKNPKIQIKPLPLMVLVLLAIVIGHSFGNHYICTREDVVGKSVV